MEKAPLLSDVEGGDIGSRHGAASEAQDGRTPRLTKTFAVVAFVAAVLLVSTSVLLAVVVVNATLYNEGADESDTAPVMTDYSMLQGFCAGVRPIATSEYLDRQARVAAQLRAEGAKLFVTEPGPTMLYLTNVSWKISERPFLLLINDQGDVTWVSPAFEEDTARERVGDDAVMLLWQENDNLYQMIFAYYGSPISGFTVVVEPEIRLYIADGLRQAFGADNTQIVGLELIRTVRAVKTASEINILRCANELTKRAIQEVVKQFFRDGVTEDAVHAELVKAQSTGGLTDIWSLVLFDTNAAYPHGTSNRLILERGYMVLIDTGGDLYGYQSDISRTLTHPYGSYTLDQQKWWNATRDAQQAALRAIQPGQPCGNVDDAARRVVESAGYGANYTSFTHRLGHGIGMQGHEEVYMVRGNTYPMTPGLCFSVEPGIYIMGVGGVRIEDIVCATAEAPYYEFFGPASLDLSDPLRLYS